MLTECCTVTMLRFKNTSAVRNNNMFLSFLLFQFLVESLHSRHVTALRCTPDQSNEALQEEAAHQRELALDILSHVAHVFDFPDLNRFLSVSHIINTLAPHLPRSATDIGWCFKNKALQNNYSTCLADQKWHTVHFVLLIHTLQYASMLSRNQTSVIASPSLTATESMCLLSWNKLILKITFFVYSGLYRSCFHSLQPKPVLQPLPWSAPSPSSWTSTAGKCSLITSSTFSPT